MERFIVGPAQYGATRFSLGINSRIDKPCPINLASEVLCVYKLYKGRVYLD